MHALEVCRRARLFLRVGGERLLGLVGEAELGGALGDDDPRALPHLGGRVRAVRVGEEAAHRVERAFRLPRERVEQAGVVEVCAAERPARDELRDVSEREVFLLLVGLLFEAAVVGHFVLAELVELALHVGGGLVVERLRRRLAAPLAGDLQAVRRGLACAFSVNASGVAVRLDARLRARARRREEKRERES